MRPFLIAVVIAGLSTLSPICWGQRSCSVRVEASVEVSGGEFSLADLLTPDTCPALRREAAGIRLGAVPLAGSVRVLAGGEVSELLHKLVHQLSKSMPPGAAPPASLRVPERIPQRITIRRAGQLASCADIGRAILPARLGGRGAGQPPDAGNPPQELDCGAAGRIPRDTPLELTRTVWDLALGTWDVSARCVHAGDCVPFLVRVPPGNRETESWLKTRNPVPLPAAVGGKPLVRPGQPVTLLWDQGGIRLVVPAVSLDRGGAGEPVRARIVNSGLVVRAIVESAGRVRSVS